MTAEIPVSCGIWSGNHSQTVRKSGQFQFLLKLHKPLLLQPLYGLALLELGITHGKLRIDIINHQTESVELGIIDLGTGHNLLPCGKSGSRSLLEKSRQELETGAPNHSLDLGKLHSPLALDEFEVAMTVGAYLH